MLVNILGVRLHLVYLSLKEPNINSRLFGNFIITLSLLVV